MSPCFPVLLRPDDYRRHPDAENDNEREGRHTDDKSSGRVVIRSDRRIGLVSGVVHERAAHYQAVCVLSDGRAGVEGRVAFSVRDGQEFRVIRVGYVDEVDRVDIARAEHPDRERVTDGEPVEIREEARFQKPRVRGYDAVPGVI